MVKTIDQLVEDLLLDNPTLTLEVARKIEQLNNHALFIKELIHDTINTTEVKSLKEEVRNLIK